MSKFRSIAEAVMILGLLVLGGIELSEDKAYFCEERKIALNCEKVSGSRCYFEKDDGSTSYKVCRGGWTKFSNVIGVAEDIKLINPNLLSKPSGDFTTSPDGKICYLGGDLRRGVPCSNQ